MRILYDLFEVEVNYFQGFILMYFPFAFLGGKYSDKFLKNLGWLFAVILATTISVMNRITIFEHLLTFAYILIIFMFSVTCLKGKMIYKIFASIYPVVIVSAVSVMSSSLFSVIFNKSISEIIVQQNWQRIVSVLITQLIIFYMIIISLRIFSQNKESSYNLTAREWAMITVTLLLSILIVVLFVMVSYNKTAFNVSLYIVGGVFAVIVINIVLLYFIIDLGKKSMSQLENEKLKLQITYNQQYIENADTEYKLIMKLRHDNKAIYQVLADQLKNKEYEKATDYLRKITDIAEERIIFVNTDNDIANSIINAKLTIAKNFGMNVSCMTINQFDGIDDIDLCRLLSNMLDNAITATSNLDIADKRLSLRINEDIGTYTFLVCNTIKNSILQDNPQLLSTKRNKDTSGYGTKIIKDIAEKYSGKCDFYEKDGSFCCAVIINGKL